MKKITCYDAIHARYTDLGYLEAVKDGEFKEHDIIISTLAFRCHNDFVRSLIEGSSSSEEKPIGFLNAVEN